MFHRMTATRALRRCAGALTALTAACLSALALPRCDAVARPALDDFLELSRARIAELALRSVDVRDAERRRAALGDWTRQREHIAGLNQPAQPLRGVFDPLLMRDGSRWSHLEDSFQARFQLVALYVGWSKRPEGRFPRERSEAIWANGAAPLLTWEPWVAALDATAPADGAGSLADIASGRYDRYIDDFAKDVAAFGHPLYLRFAHEMNDPFRYPWGPRVANLPAQFVAAFRHVHSRFARAGAHGVSWVWSPSIAYAFEEYYPGADVVDWSATAVLNYGTTARWSEWWSFEELLGPRYEALRQYGHPLMVAELGTVGEGGDAAAWYAGAESAIARRFSDVRALVLFHDDNDASLGERAVSFDAAGEPRTAAAAARLLSFTPAAAHAAGGPSETSPR